MQPDGMNETGTVRYEPLLSRGRRAACLIGMVAWILAGAYYWVWWLDPSHIERPVLFWTLSIGMAWATLYPLYFMVHYTGAIKLLGNTADLPPLRVAMVVTKAPSEPFAIVEKTLNAMLAQAHPHDTWLADENPTPEVYAWCEANGVKVSTRFGREDYHQTTWPRRTRCKEGNLAFFYDHYGYDNYDVVVQLDADHIPAPGYLEQMLIPFGDPRVGYVAAPSICDNNASESWSARGRLHAEGNLHGALQAGYTAIGSPLCFGSHYAVRTRALREIGGLGPELAEDHSTTMMFCAHGWRGAHAIDAVAHGDGPSTFTDLITQEFQWARSLMMILLRYSPKYLQTVTPRQRFMFRFAQYWYPIYSFFMAMGILIPVFGVVFRVNFANVTFPDFVAHALPMPIVLAMLAILWRSHGTYRPFDVKLFSWELVAFQFARWPWSLMGCLAAVWEHLTNKYVVFRVTPKGTTEADPLPLRVLMPYAVVSLISALPCLLVSDAADATGFYIFALANAVIYAGMLFLIIIRHHVENRVRPARRTLKVAVAAMLALAFILPSAGLNARGLEGINALSQGARFFSLTHTSFSPSGAGHGPRRTLRFDPKWTLQ
jgi:cellulose synthase (UDP-forming)